MADNRNDIDELFRQQFDGYKDRTVDPAAQWASFEAMLNRQQRAAASGNSILANFFSSNKTVLSIAASLALLLSFVVWFNGADQVEINPPISGTTLNHYSPLLIQKLKAQSDQKTPSLNYLLPLGSKNIEARNELAYSAADDAKKESFSISTTKNQRVETEKNSQKKIMATIDASASLKNFSSDEFIHHSDIKLMPIISLFNNSIAGLAEKSEIENTSYLKLALRKTDGIFVRLGVRFGNGESNSAQVSNFWAGNALASIGFKKAFSSNIGLMSELTYLRRSGNGLERNQSLEVDRLNIAFNNSVNQVSPSSGSTFSVDKSIIATRLDYVQIPISFYFEPTNNSEISAGVYTDILLHAKNETYLIYNQKDYVSREPNATEIKSQNGLNKIRYGISAGFQREIMPNISLDLKALLPINDALSSNSDQWNNIQVNRSIDFYLGLRYTL